MTGIDDLIICPRCLKPMGEEIDVTTCQHCGYKDGEPIYFSDCIYFDYWQDTDDEGRYIAPPVFECDKGHDNCKECKDYKSCYDD